MVHRRLRSSAQRSLVAAGSLCFVLGVLAARMIPAATATSCVLYEMWRYELESFDGPDSRHREVWPPSVSLDTEGPLKVWERDPETGFGGKTVFEAYPED